MSVISFIVFGAIPLMVLCNNIQVNPPPQDVVDLTRNVHSLEDFMELLTVNGRPVRDDDIFSPHPTEDGKRVITGGGVFALSDECSPRNVTVRLDLDFSNPQVAYYPECTMVQRCGGCCPTRFLSCEPAYKENIVLKVLKAKYEYPGAPSMEWEGFTSVVVEQHMSCRAVCSLRPEQCRGPDRQYVPHQCACHCLNVRRCTYPQHWDSETCSCRCRNQHEDCCEGQENPSECPLFFNRNLCQCTFKSYIGFSVNASQAEIDAWLAAQEEEEGGHGNQRMHDHVSSEIPVTSTTTTATTTTTTTTTEAPENPCPSSRNPCPPNFVWQMNRRGRCVCQLNFTRNRFPGK